ncbi:MAG: hypothetical protein CUN55_03770 [Phototrophicales bacterium]|nr:MAG: hypothetical protein CUN55_03770 [Phototrophicales bacterium]
MQKWTAFLLSGLLAIAFVVGLFIKPVDSEANSTAYWKAEFFDNLSANGSPILTRNDRELSFNWAEEAPAPSLPTDGFSARWTAKFEFEAGTWTFALGADDGVRLWIDDELVIDEWSPKSKFTVYQATVDLEEGIHKLRVAYFDQEGLAGISLHWSPAPIPTQPPVPASVKNDPPINPAQDDTRSVANVATGRLNVRSGPGIQYERITQIFLYERYRILGQTTNDSGELWYQIDLRDGRLGWVSARYVLVTGNPNPPVVTFDLTPPAVEVFENATGLTLYRLAVRSGPSLDSDIIDYLDYNTEVTVLGRNSTSVWYKITYDGGTAWVFSPYVRLIDAAPYDVPFVQ